MAAPAPTSDWNDQPAPALSGRMTAAIGAFMLLSTLYLAGITTGEAQASQQCASPCADNALSVGYPA